MYQHINLRLVWLNHIKDQAGRSMTEDSAHTDKGLSPPPALSSHRNSSFPCANRTVSFHRKKACILQTRYRHTLIFPYLHRAILSQKSPFPRHSVATKQAMSESATKTDGTLPNLLFIPPQPDPQGQLVKRGGI